MRKELGGRKMEKNNVEKRLDMSLSQKPILKADEKKKYLGNFRERIVLTMTLSESQSEYYQQSLKEFVEKGFKYEVAFHLNSELDSHIQSVFIQLAQRMNIPFVIHNLDSSLTKDSLVFAIATKTMALNQEIIDIAALFPETMQQVPKEKTLKKKGFFSKFFRG